MVTNNNLQRDVMEELEYDPGVDHTRIGVAVRDGVVTLSGTVENYVQKLTAEKAARRVSGVKAIVEELRVELPFAPATGDGEIARRIVNVLGWDSAFPKKGIGVKVEDGWVTLSGEVDWHYQTDAARNAAARIDGVRGVTNLLVVRKQPMAGDIRQRILDAFERSADVDASAVHVVTDGGTVRLSGKVKAWHEREMAERAAWAAPGVTNVEDHIVLSF